MYSELKIHKVGFCRRKCSRTPKTSLKSPCRELDYPMYLCKTKL